MAADPLDEQSRWILIGAILASVGLHLALLIFFAFFSFASAILADEPEERITFTFSEPVDDAASDRPPLGDLSPEPSRPVERVQPTPQTPAPESPTQPQQAVSIPLPTQPVDPLPAPDDDPTRLPPDPTQAPVEDPSDEPSPDAEADEQSRDDPDPDPGMDIPSSDQGGIRRGANSSSGGINFDRALENFGDAVRRAQARNPRAVPPTRRNMFVPEAADMPPNGVGYGMFEFESRDYDWSDYMRQLYIEIMRTWYPTMDRSVAEFERWGRSNNLFLDDRVTVRFTILKSGDVTDIQVIVPSPCGPLDESATDTLDIVLLQPLPEDFPRDRERVTGTFLIRGWTHQMGSYFSWLKRQGHWTMKSRSDRLENSATNPYSSPRN